MCYQLMRLIAIAINDLQHSQNKLFKLLNHK